MAVSNSSTHLYNPKTLAEENYDAVFISDLLQHMKSENIPISMLSEVAE